MNKQQVVLVTHVNYFSIKEHCEEEAYYEDPPEPEDYNYKYGCRIDKADASPDCIIALSDNKTPIQAGDLITIEFVEIDRDGDKVWRLCDG